MAPPRAALTQPNDVRTYPSPWVAWTGVAILFLVYASSFVDRQISSLLVGPIRADLAISDTGFSLLHGFAFSLFYVVLGAPIGKLVDRVDRRHVLCVGIATWSVFTCLCGRANSFAALFIARIGVGVGEATVAPATYSLLADYFPPERRGLPMGVFGAGVYVGIGAALIIGGALVQALVLMGPISLPLIGRVAPWQLAFLIAGAPGIPLCLFVLFICEPRRPSRASTAIAQAEPKGILMAHWRANGVAIFGHHGATACLAMALYAELAWAPEYFKRTHGLATGQSSMTIGLLVLLFGTAGVLAGGLISDRLLARGIISARLIVLASAALCAMPFTGLFALAQSPMLAFTGFGGSIFCLAMLTICGPTGVQELNPPELRGVGAALFQFIVTLVGLGVGPTLVAVVSDGLNSNGTHLNLALGLTVPAMCFAAGVIALVVRNAYAAAAKRVAKA